ncbi:MAG: hypothetical protein WCJ72_15250 [Chryseobacterium sp.]
MNLLHSHLKHFPFLYVIAPLLIWGLIYCGLLNLTPSSYSIVLHSIHSNEKPLLGTAKEIRADEYNVLTPLFQIAAHNHFERYNNTSPYAEDLRAFIVLPLKDFALLFKPSTWLFHVTKPALAYSFYYYFYFCLFILGYFYLFQSLRFTPTFSLLSAFLIYFSSFTQYWYTIIIGQLAWFPLLLLAWNIKNPLWRLLALYYAGSALLFSSFYTPGILMLAYAGGLIVIIYFRSSLTLKSSLSGLLALLAALVGFLFYTQDALKAMTETIYPGNRIVAAGSLQPQLLLDYIFPSIGMIGEQNIMGMNICEISTLSSYALLLLLIFVKSPRAILSHIKTDINAKILLCSILFLLSFMLLPLPVLLSKLFFMHKITFERWFFVLGFLLYLLLLTLLPKTEFIFNKERIYSFCRIIAFSLLLKIYAIMQDSPANYEVAFWVGIVSVLKAYQSYTIVFLLLFFYHFRKAFLTENPALGIITICTLSNIIAFGMFNPYQSAEPIFNPPQTEYLQSLKTNPENFIANYYIGDRIGKGAANNGLGFYSINHVQMIPNLAFFHVIFAPYLTPEQFNNCFNRYAHLVLYDDINAKNAITFYQTDPLFSRDLLTYPFSAYDQEWALHSYKDIIFLPKAFIKRRLSDVSADLPHRN